MIPVNKVKCFVLPFFSRAVLYLTADPSDRAVYGVSLRPHACWDCEFETRRGHGCFSVESVVCCQVEVSASG
jgi:hypothetical protein